MRGRNPTAEDKVELAKRQQRFLKRLDAFHRQGAELFPDTDFLDPFVLNPPLEDDFEHDDDIELLAANPPSADDKLPENMDIVLPSSFDILPEGMEIACTHAANQPKLTNIQKRALLCHNTMVWHCYT